MPAIDVSAEAKAAAGFPGHGWARSSFGHKMLWLPVKSTFHTRYWLEKGVRELPSGLPITEARTHCDAFWPTLADLCIVLRELGRLRRLGSELMCPVTKRNPGDEILNKSMRVNELTRPALDLAYVYLRRLADRFAASARFFLFANPKKAPHKFKNLRATIANAEKLRSLGPLCEPSALQTIFRDHCLWFERLRGGPTEEHGLRDLLEHYPVRVMVGGQASSGGSSSITAHIVRSNRLGPELFNSLSEITAGLCDFLSRILPLMDTRTAYGFSDYQTLIGNHEDSTAFWPQIGPS